MVFSFLLGQHGHCTTVTAGRLGLACRRPRLQGGARLRPPLYRQRPHQLACGHARQAGALLRRCRPRRRLPVGTCPGLAGVRPNSPSPAELANGSRGTSGRRHRWQMVAGAWPATSYCGGGSTRAARRHYRVREGERICPGGWLAQQKRVGGDGKAEEGGTATPWSTTSGGRSGEDSDHGLDFGPPTSIALAERTKETR
jgi:hypothetical protein